MSKKTIFSLPGLTPAAIDEASEKLTDFLQKAKCDKHEATRVRLQTEEILLAWHDRFGEKTEAKMTCGKSFGSPQVRLSLAGEAFDPLTPDDENAWTRKMMAGMQTQPVYKYRDGKNVVTFRFVEKKRGALLWVLCAFVLAVIVGLLGTFLPDTVRLFAADKVIFPLVDRYLHVLNFFGVPLIFFTLINGICSIGDAPAFSGIAKKGALHFVKSLAMVILLAMVLVQPLFRFNFGENGFSMDLEGLYAMVLDFFPESPLTPFLEANAMQLILMALAMGLAILVLRPVGDTLARFNSDLGAVLAKISTWFTKVIAPFVFLSVVLSLWQGQAQQLLRLVKPWAIILLIEWLMLFLLSLQLSVAHKVPLATLLRKCVSTYLIALGTNSCNATIPEIFDTAERMGVPKDETSFGVPVGTTLYKPSMAIRFIVLACFVAAAEKIPVSVPWLITLTVLAFVLSIVAPMIPGGAMMFYPMLFSSLGLPAAALAPIIAADFFFDAPCTAACMVNDELAMVQQAGKMKMLDEETLRKKG